LTPQFFRAFFSTDSATPVLLTSPEISFKVLP